MRELLLLYPVAAQFVYQHEALLTLAAFAFIGTMPDELPDGWRQIPDWCYGWLQSGLKTFVSMRGPKQPSSPPKP